MYFLWLCWTLDKFISISELDLIPFILNEDSNQSIYPKFKLLNKVLERYPIHSLKTNNMIFKKVLPILFIYSMLFIGCATSNNSSSSESNSQNTSEATYEISMLDIMRKSSGVMVRGTGNDAKITVRIKNFYNDEVGEPLFLVNGVNYANNFQSVQNSINPEDVKSVEVYKTPAELMRYGVSGEHGVINIIMK